jgi:hypothetical protein
MHGSKPAMARIRRDDFLQRLKPRREPRGERRCFVQVGEFEARGAPDRLVRAKRIGAAGTVDGIERVLVRGDERAFARCERHEEVAARRRAANADRARHTERNTGEADEALDAARQFFRRDLRALTSNLVYAVTILAQPVVPCPHRFA